MKLKSQMFALSILVVVLGCHHVPPITQLAGTPNWEPDEAHATELNDEETKGNGIEVGAPKVYDDASLRMMLDATRAKLATMSGLDQGSLIANLGSISGATINQTQFGFQVTGPGSPAATTTNTGATNSTTTNDALPAGNTTVPGTVTVTTNPTQSTVTTSATPPASPAVPPGIAFTPPASVSPSSLDVLNEQMQLSYEMTNLQLLLEGALSDRFVTNQRFIKPRVTLGFPISLRAPAQFKDAVAVVEVEVKTSPLNFSAPSVPEPPAITALLPQEKTYNVAAMTDHMTSIGGGALIGTVGVAASYLAGHKTLYLVQDQDTVAMQRPPSADKNSTSFLWEFRPVLGQHYVRGGMKQTFVQLSLPIRSNVDCYGTVRIRTYWRRFDQKNGIDGSVISESVLISKRTFPLSRYDLAPSVGSVEYEDLGDGTVLVTVKGDPDAGTYLLAGSYIQLGATRYDAGKNLVVEDTDAKFIAPMAALAKWNARIVARNGAGTDILNPLVQTPLRALQQTACIGEAKPEVPCPAPPPQTDQGGVAPTLPSVTIKRVSVVPLDETNTILSVVVETNMTQNQEKLLLVIGGKVFGLRDAPVQRQPGNGGSIILGVTVPTSLLISNPQVRVFLPFWSNVESTTNHNFDAFYSLDTSFGLDSAVDHIALVSVDQDGNGTYLLYGNGLEKAKILVPDKGVALQAIDNVPQGRLQLLKVTKAALQTTKKIVLQKGDTQRPLLLDIPEAKPTPPKVSVDSPVIVGSTELDISAEQAAEIASVKLGDKALQWKPVDKSTIRLLNLKADGVTNEQKTREVTIEYKNGVKVTLKFDVVAARIGVKSGN
jgi:hypothetical protein